MRVGKQFRIFPQGELGQSLIAAHQTIACLRADRAPSISRQACSGRISPEFEQFGRGRVLDTNDGAALDTAAIAGNNRDAGHREAAPHQGPIGGSRRCRIQRHANRGLACVAGLIGGDEASR